eukprot:scaffold5295_cov76-Amphora_coffeaeformis.AAC.1
MKAQQKDSRTSKRNEGTPPVQRASSSDTAIPQTTRDKATGVAISGSALSANGRPQIDQSKRDMSHIAFPHKSNTTPAKTVKMTVLSDSSVTSCANAVIKEQPRGALIVSFDEKPVSDGELTQIAVRLHECDPFWEIVAYVNVFQTNP